MLTIKRISIALTKEDLRELKFLENYLGESQSQIIRRALINLYRELKNEKESSGIPKL